MSTAFVSSNAVIKDRLKNGQCVHCGVQTHKIVGSALRKKRIPQTIPGVVDHGRCLLASCQNSGNNVKVDEKADDARKQRFTAHGVVQAVGTATTMTGAVLTALGVPAGEVLVGVGTAVTEATPPAAQVTQAESLCTNPYIITNANYNPYENVMQNYMNQMEASLQSQNEVMNNLHPQVVQAEQAKVHPLMQPDFLQACNNIDNGFHQAAINLENCFINNCNLVDKIPPTMPCGEGHVASIMKVLPGWSYICDICDADLPAGVQIYGCTRCHGNWTACLTHGTTTSAAIKCQEGHQTEIMAVQPGWCYSCDICDADLPAGVQVYGCTKCPETWTACLKHEHKE